MDQSHPGSCWGRLTPAVSSIDHAFCWAICGFPSMAVPPNGWSTMENPIRTDDLEVPPFQETSISPEQILQPTGKNLTLLALYCNNWSFQHFWADPQSCQRRCWRHLWLQRRILQNSAVKENIVRTYGWLRIPASIGGFSHHFCSGFNHPFHRSMKVTHTHTHINHSMTPWCSEAAGLYEPMSLSRWRNRIETGCQDGETGETCRVGLGRAKTNKNHLKPTKTGAITSTFAWIEACKIRVSSPASTRKSKQ